jgi:hypothetical protein
MTCSRRGIVEAFPSAGKASVSAFAVVVPVTAFVIGEWTVRKLFPGNKEESRRSRAIFANFERMGNRTSIYMPLVSPANGVTLTHPVVLRGTSGGFDHYPTAYH